MSEPRTALVVDDNAVNRILASRLLSKTGWVVVQAASGQEALDWLAHNQAALILLDVSMPVMSGQEVCRRIRERGFGGNDVKIAAYTAHAMPEEIKGFMDSGFDTVLLKPMTRDRLAETLQSLGFI